MTKKCYPAEKLGVSHKLTKNVPINGTLEFFAQLAFDHLGDVGDVQLWLALVGAWRRYSRPRGCPQQDVITWASQQLKMPGKSIQHKTSENQNGHWHGRIGSQKQSKLLLMRLIDLKVMHKYAIVYVEQQEDEGQTLTHQMAARRTQKCNRKHCSQDIEEAEVACEVWLRPTTMTSVKIGNFKIQYFLSMFPEELATSILKVT